MKKLSRSNIFSASAEEICALFGDYLEGDASRPLLVASGQPLDETARDALEKSFASFGYGQNACTYVTLTPVESAQGGIAIDPQALYLLVEGLDPLCIVCADAAALDVLSRAYRTQYEPDSAARVFGRPAVMFRNLDASLASEAGKQRVWHLLKSLPKR